MHLTNGNFGRLRYRLVKRLYMPTSMHSTFLMVNQLLTLIVGLTVSWPFFS